MTHAGSGGVTITEWCATSRYARDLKKLTAELQERIIQKLEDLKANPRPPGLGFEKLKGHSNPAIYTIHITGNYKVSFEIVGSVASLRRVAPHDEIDRAP